MLLSQTNEQAFEYLIEKALLGRTWRRAEYLLRTDQKKKLQSYV